MQFNTQRPYIHGQFVDASSSETFQSINPANAEVLATIQACNQADVDRAVQSAKQGQSLGSHDHHAAFTHFKSGRSHFTGTQ